MTDYYTFNATEAGVEQNDDCLVATLDSGQTSYVMFQRHVDFGSANDDGIYVEIEDQINANCGCVENCTITDTNFSLNLLSPLLGFYHVRAKLNLPAPQLKSFTTMLHRIFTGYETLLQIESRP